MPNIKRIRGFNGKDSYASFKWKEKQKMPELKNSYSVVRRAVAENLGEDLFSGVGSELAPVTTDDVQTWKKSDQLSSSDQGNTHRPLHPSFDFLARILRRL